MAWLTLEEEEHVSYPKKVWKGITSTIESKLRRLRRSRTFIKTTKYVLARLPSSNRRCHHHHHHVHIYYHDYHYDHHHHQQGLQTQRRLPNMHVDKLLLGNNTVNNQRYLNLQIENEKDKALVESVEVIDHDDEDDWQDVNEHLEDDDEEEDENLYALVDTINSKTLILRGVNAKSENFINNFYEGLKLEKQKSIEELCHMLALGV
jgi:hypothetical protein|uniref:Uncharacterized protein n=1 Tax=Fagus sylvatica TaxID=28930 RepID=A0A2N9IK38_FAGSY